jgi:hypothetical protein
MRPVPFVCFRRWLWAFDRGRFLRRKLENADRSVPRDIDARFYPGGLGGFQGAGSVPLLEPPRGLTHLGFAFAKKAVSHLRSNFTPKSKQQAKVDIHRLFRRILTPPAHSAPCQAVPCLAVNGDIYFRQPRGTRNTPDGEFAGAREGFDTMRYSEPEVARIAHVAFQAARKRRKKVCNVDKANVLETSQVWRDTVIRVSAEYPDIELSHM